MVALTIRREIALYYVVPSRNEEVVKLLLEKGVDLEATSSNGRTALFHVFGVDFTCEPILNLLLAKGANVNVSERFHHETPLHLAAENGNEWAVRSLLANGANVMDRDFLGHTTLHIAAESGNEAVVRILLEKGAEVSAFAVEDPDNTPRNYAESNGHEAIARLLDEAATQRVKNLA